MAVIDNLTASWEMDEASGDALDAHGTLDLTDTNTVGTNGSGWRDFEADSVEYFSHADHADLDTGNNVSFSFEASVNLESKTVQRIIVRKWDGGSSQFSYIFAYDVDGSIGGTADRFCLLVRNSVPTATAAVATSLGSPSLATNYLIHCGWDSATTEVWIKVNNGTRDAASHTGGAAATAAPFLVGHSADETADWDGLMRRLRLWKKTLTADEMTWLFNGSASTGRSYADIVAEAGGGAAPYASIPKQMGVRRIA